MYQRKVDVDMLNVVLADVSSVSPSSDQRELETLETSANTLSVYGVRLIHINLTLIHCMF